MKSSRILLALLMLTLSVVALYPLLPASPAAAATPGGAQPPPKPRFLPLRPFPAGQQRPQVDLVFVIDTTGSMSGLIAAAKEKVWSIATTMAQANPAPEIRVGLVAYRDQGDEYVTRTFDLTNDLDAMYAALMAFQAAGGGDGPEAVNQALSEAVNNLSWRRSANAYKAIFLLGDAPPHLDYQNDVQYPQTLALARERGIVVNAVQCGAERSTTQTWQQIAALGQGEFIQVEQNGSAVALATPFDDKLAALASELDATRLYYGDAETLRRKAAKLEATAKLEAAAPAASRARRATFNVTRSGRDSLLGDHELVADLTEGKVQLESLKVSELPAALQPLAPAAREAFVTEQANKREKLKEEIAASAAERNAWLEKQVAASGEAESSLDHKLYRALRAQAADKGLHYAAPAPAY